MDFSKTHDDKTASELAGEAIAFLLHTMVAVAALIAVVAAFSLVGTDASARTPKLLCTALAFAVPSLIGALSTFIREDDVAQNIWLAGVLTSLMVSVHVLDLPTGTGLCENCGALEKLWRTFFSIDRNSGLLGGDGILIGTWLPLAMGGYALGARLRQPGGH